MYKEVDGQSANDSDLGNDMANEYGSNEGISVPVPTKISRKHHFEMPTESKDSPYKLNHQGSSTNTLAKAGTYHRSVESSGSITRSPNLVLNSNSNLLAKMSTKSKIVGATNLTDSKTGKVQNYASNQPLKTYVLNKSRKLNSNLNRSEKD